MASEHNREYAPIEKNKIRRYYYFGTGFAVLFLVLLLSAVHAVSTYRDYQQKIIQLSSGIIEEKQHFLKDAIDRTVFFIESEREMVRQEFTSRNLSESQLDEISADRVGKYIRKLRLIDDGYIWVNHIVDYRGGDKYAVRQIHPNLPDTEGQWLSTETTDIKGNKPYLTELNGVKEKGELFFEYYFKKLNSDEIAHKMTFAKLYKPWDWVVATGVYLDDVDALVRKETREMESTIKTQIIYTGVIAAVALLISGAILSRFEKQISGLLRAYEHDIERYTDRLLEEKEKTEAALAEVKQLKGLLPICSYCKKIRDDSGYWTYLESYITDHSGAEFSHGVCPDCAKILYAEISALSDKDKPE